MNSYSFKEYEFNNKKYISMTEVVKRLGVAQNNIKAKHPLFKKYVIKDKVLTNRGLQVMNLIESNMLSVYIDSFTRKIDKSIIGYVYLIQYTENIYKIGCAIDFNKRLKSLITQYPFDLKVIHKVKVSDYFNIEQQLHKKYNKKLVKNKKEFFEFSQNEIKGVIRVMNKYVDKE